jgi:hypothetical protein
MRTFSKRSAPFCPHLTEYLVFYQGYEFEHYGNPPRILNLRGIMTAPLRVSVAWLTTKGYRIDSLMDEKLFCAYLQDKSIHNFT